jgi:hypothetical protein
VRIIELPLALCPDGELSLSVLTHRDDGLARGFSVWLRDAYNPVETYELFASHTRFAQVGTLLDNYDANTKTIDNEFGLRLQMSGADRTIAMQSLGKALANDLLLFVDDEIMSVISVTLEAADIYHLHVIRNRLGSARATHLGGAGVYLVAREDLQALRHPTFEGGNEVSFKVALSFGRYEQDLSELTALTHAVANRILTEPALLNLRFNGSLRDLNWTGGDVRFDWTLTDGGRALARPDLWLVQTRIDFVANPASADFTAIEDYTLIGTEVTAGDSLDVTAVDLAALVGSDPFFVIARRQISTPDFTALSAPVVLYLTQ